MKFSIVLILRLIHVVISKAKIHVNVVLSLMVKVITKKNPKTNKQMILSVVRSILFFFAYSDRISFVFRMANKSFDTRYADQYDQ